MQYKTTTKLFHGTYQYKIVLVSSGVSIFRNGVSAASETITSIQNQDKIGGYNIIKNKEDLHYISKLLGIFKKIKDFDYRIESPWLSVYSNSKQDVDKLANLDKNRVKYISIPPESGSLVENTVLMPKKNFDFKVTLGRTTSEHTTFVEWAEGNKNLELTKSCKRDLTRDRSWGGTHFYVTGEKNLMLTKIHLGTNIAKIERIVKA